MVSRDNIAPNGAADLHIHSIFSDGTFSPSEIVQQAFAIGIQTIALTDHDTVSGNHEASEAAKKTGIDFIPGIEISVNSSYGSLHMLGLGLFRVNNRLEELISKIQIGRRNRNPQIIRKLQILGYSISFEEVQQLARSEIIGRPHIAQVLINHQYVTDQDEAFHRFLNTDAAAYVHRWRPSIDDAIEIIRSSDGIPILAHPGFIEFPRESSREAFIRSLKEMGLQGLEVHYPSHSVRKHELLQSLAKKYNLLITGGSDFHGGNKPGSLLGKGTDGRWITSEYASGIKNPVKSASKNG